MMAESWSAGSKNGGDGKGREREENIFKGYLEQRWRRLNIIFLVCNPFVLVLSSLKRIVIKETVLVLWKYMLKASSGKCQKVCNFQMV